LIGNGTSALLAVAPSTAGNVLTSNGTTWASTAPAATVNSFSAGTTGLTPSTTTTGAVTLAGTLAVANGGTGVTTSSGTGAGVHVNTPTFTGVPAAPTAANATNTTQLATTAFAYGTLSATTNGYTKLANGLIIQWGRANVNYNGTQITVTMPIAMPTALLCATATISGTNDQISGGVGSPQTNANNFTTTTFTIFGDYTSDAPTNVPTSWIAIGY
jgi:hypothetical protein